MSQGLKMVKIRNIRRQDLIYQMLKGLNEKDGLTVDQIKTRLDSYPEAVVSTRTIRRDLGDLDSHGVSCSETRPERFYISKDYNHKFELHLNEKTLQVLLIALNNLKDTSHVYFAPLATEAETAIFDSLDPDLIKELHSEKDKYYFDYGTSGKPNIENEKDFDFIMQAIRSNRTIRCNNLSPYQDEEYNKRKRNFAPYLFILSAGTPYIIAKDLDDNKFKRLRASRLINVEVSKESFVREDYSTQLNLDSMFGGFGGGKGEACKNHNKM